MASGVTTARLYAALAAVCPIATVRVTGPTSATYEATPSATADQQVAANAALAAFDWSEAAEVVWLRGLARQAQQTLIDGNDNAATAALRAVALVMLDELNVLRALHSLPARTAAQLKTAIKSKISDGSAD